MNEEKKESAYERGFFYEETYHGCAQCVIGAIYELFPHMRNEDIFRSASGLAAGTGLSAKGQCGALSGAVMVLSQIWGRELAEIEDPERKRFVAYRLSEELVSRFMKEFGTVICGEIQTKLMGTSFYLPDPEQFRQFEDAGGHSTICPSVVGKATAWAAEIIERETRKA